MATMNDYAGREPAWCKGCGNFGILKSLTEALVALGIEPWQVLMVSGIGDAGKLPHYTKGNVFHGLHGRQIPAAIGAKVANPELTVVAVGGDGDTYGEGGNHLLHAMRCNFDVTCLVHNNQVYGLTKGQASPTSDPGFITTTTPWGAGAPINPLALAVASNASFVGRGFAGDTGHLTELLREGISHQGFALIDILQPCVSFNSKNTFGWFRERVYRLEESDGYDPTDKRMAMDKAGEWEERIPIGIVYKAQRPVFEEEVLALGETPLAKRQLEPSQVGELFAGFH